MDPGEAAAMGGRIAATQFVTLASIAILAISIVVMIAWALFGAPLKHTIRLLLLLIVMLGSAGLFVLALASG
jgi:hypothetical protein